MNAFPRCAPGSHGCAACLLGACSSVPHPQSTNDEAAGYNVQLGLGYLQKGDLSVAKEKLERAQAKIRAVPRCTARSGCCTNDSAT
jgi:Tfp pilus assembly protein PilF